MNDPRQEDLFAPRPPGPAVVDETTKRDRGMATAAANNAARLALARAAARRVALAGDGTADVERVRDALAAAGHVFPWGNWAGSVFKTAEWTFTGEWVPARHAGGHARPVRVWRRT